VRASIVLNSRNGREKDDLLDVVGSANGAIQCHTLFECTAVCPRGVAPTVAIQKLKRHVLKHKLAKLLQLPVRSGG
jgi:succinate dehydrogenase/fumarate reductase-like Fe-S protein